MSIKKMSQILCILCRNLYYTISRRRGRSRPLGRSRCRSLTCMGGCCRVNGSAESILSFDRIHIVKMRDARERLDTVRVDIPDAGRKTGRPHKDTGECRQPRPERIVMISHLLEALWIALPPTAAASNTLVRYARVMKYSPNAYWFIAGYAA